MYRLSHLIAIAALSSASLWFSVNAQSINITGSVVDNGTSAGIANAKVKLVEFPSCTTRTDANGGFTLSGPNTAIRLRLTPAVSACKMALLGNRLLVTTAAQPVGIVVDVFNILGKQMFHAEQFAAGAAEFASLWKTTGLYYVRVQVGNEVRILSNFGANRNFTVPLPENNAPKGLAKTSAVYTIEAGKSGYDSKQTALSSTTGTGIVIRLSAYSQAPGTLKEVTPSADSKAGAGGIMSVVLDPARPSDLWFAAAHRGVWKSTDYGVTWARSSIDTATWPPPLNAGAPWYFGIEKNPNRNPAVAPAIYSVSGYGGGGIWKSIDGGYNFTQVWNHNVYGSDGVTNVYDELNNNVYVVLMVGLGPNDVICGQHTYYGANGNNGIMETKDGGGKWVFHNSPFYAISAHNDRPFIIDSLTWCVIHAPQVYRSTDAGNTWALANGTMANMSARSVLVEGSTVYASSQLTGLFKSTDKGASWTDIRPNNYTGWIVASATKHYICSAGYAGGGTSTIMSAPIGNDAAWTAVPGATFQSVSGSYDAVSTFDGTHHIIVAACQDAGIYRYVEP